MHRSYQEKRSNMPNLLLCLYAYYPFANSNTNVMLPIIQGLRSYYNITVVTKNVNNKAPIEEILDNISIKRYRALPRWKYILDRISIYEPGMKTNIIRNSIAMVLKPISKLLLHSRQLQEWYPEYQLLKKELHSSRYDIIISNCCLFNSHYNVYRYKTKYGLSIPWIVFFWDPYAFYIGNIHNNSIMLEQEKQVYSLCTLAFVTKEIYEDNRTNVLSVFMSKVHPVRFTNFRINDYPLLRPIFDSHKINCVYVGSMVDESVRSPLYLYKMINLLDDRFCFHLVLNNFYKSDRESILDSKKDVRWYFNLGLEECLGIIKNADILINLGNKTLNQTPSKIYDYMGTGKPIVNIHSLDTDTSKRILEKYPLKINIFESEADIVDNVAVFGEFALKNSNEDLPASWLKSTFSDMRPDKVVEEVIEILLNNITQSKQ